MNEVIISIGSNLGDRLENMSEAIKRLTSDSKEKIKCSHVYESKAVGFSSENNFYNAVFSFSTKLSVLEVLDKISMVESAMGRLRLSKSYTDRIIDLDIIGFNNLTIDSEILTLPHPRYSRRLFVLLPLFELYPQWVDLNTCVSINEMIEKCLQESIVKLSFSICL
ncbi:MAG: 2-amino-4-hydroxy-6-hydroxymethyldihydropteridine diphosphokinase [Bacteroidia bacterium]